MLTLQLSLVLCALITVCFVAWYFTISPEVTTQWKHQDGSKRFSKPVHAILTNELGYTKTSVVTKGSKKAARKEKRKALLGIKISGAVTIILFIVYLCS